MVRRAIIGLAVLSAFGVVLAQSLNDDEKTSIAFKKVIGRDHRSDGNEFYEETAGGGINVHADDVWSEAIPATPGSCGASVCDAETLFVLTEDTTINSEKGWCAASSGNCVTGTRMRGWIPPKFGSGYEVKLYDNDDNQIFTTDAIEWYFDYETGYLALGATPTVYSQPLKVSGLPLHRGRCFGWWGNGANRANWCGGSYGCRWSNWRCRPHRGCRSHWCSRTDGRGGEQRGRGTDGTGGI